MGQRIFRLTRASSSGSKQVLYLHGGAYVYEIMAVQWKLIGKLLDSTDVSVTVPLYPLAPEHTAEQVLNFVSEVYEDLRRDEQSGPVVSLETVRAGEWRLL